jgi:hypothetical protein
MVFRYIITLISFYLKTDMRNFEKDLQDATREELLNWINRFDVNVVKLASDELTRRYLKDLEESIKENNRNLESFKSETLNFNKETSSQTEKMILLTKVLTGLTIVMVVGLLIQIWLSWPK